jgi:hypothetical protein
MTKRAKIFWTVTGVIVCCIGLSIAGLVYIFFKDLHRKTGPAAAYEPKCATGDIPLCVVWTDFRTAHPYPYQSVAAKQIEDGALILIVSEPSPSLTRSELDRLIRAAFGGSIQIHRLRWYIGADGWLEDVVFRIKGGAATTADPLDDPLMRDRVAVLHQALFGTAFGGDLEIVGQTPVGLVRKVAPNIQVSPREVTDWMAEDSIQWRSTDANWEQPMTWSEICALGIVGTFVSKDDSLVILTFPTTLLKSAKKDPRILEPLRVPFRKFAMSSEAAFGGVWTESGQTAILARVRVQPINLIPPLRFETFIILATQSGDELSQSYERNTVFAGKLRSGEHMYKDWAPVYLSESLIDTEFGALLNITDQMLKSWSEAGGVEYLYFNYPKPEKFPFNGHELSDVLMEKHGSSSVLFNWNTSGSAVVVNDSRSSTLTAKQTGALPVTYGADGRSKAQGGADVFEYEEEGYKYFSNLHDPNLARVVQYTVLYQIFRAIAKDNGTSEAEVIAPAVVPARAKATALLVRKTNELLNDIDAGKFQESEELIMSALRPSLNSFRATFSGVNNAQLAEILVDRFSPIARRLVGARLMELQNLGTALEAESKKLDAEIDQYNDNARINAASSRVEDSTPPELSRIRQLLIERQASFDHRYKAYEEAARNFQDPFGNLRKALFQLAVETQDLEEVRREFVRANDAVPEGAIKTPSIVVSWDRGEALTSIGGHNVSARALRLEMSKEVESLALVDDGMGNLILRYNPVHAEAIESHASSLARAIEHRGERDTSALMKLVELPTRIRPRPEALQLPSTEPLREVATQKAFGRLGARVYQEKKAFVEDLRKLAEKNDCCVFVARDERQIAYVAEPHPNPPPGIRTIEIRDTPSLVDHLTLWSRRAGTREERAVIFFGEQEAHIQALSIGATGAPNARIATLVEAVGEAAKKAPGDVAGIMHSDLHGRRSVLRTLGDAIEARSRAVLELIGVRRPKQTWRRARVANLEGERLDQILRAADWNPSRDGLPTAISMSFTTGGSRIAPEVAVVAGFVEEGTAAGRVHLQSAHADALAAASIDGATLAQYLMTVRNQLRGVPDSQLRRLVMVVEDEQGRTLFTRLDLPSEEWLSAS